MMDEEKRRFEEDMVSKCRFFAGNNAYLDVFGVLENHPELVNYFTIGELSKYCARGYTSGVISLKRIYNLKQNIEKIIFEGEEIDESPMDLPELDKITKETSESLLELL
jgi:hypothetical protein